MRGTEADVRERLAALVARPVAEPPDPGVLDAGSRDAPPSDPVAPGRAAGWVPGPPAGPGAELRARALGSAMAAYTAAHGHPLDAQTLDAQRLEPPRRRWGLGGRAAVVAAGALLALGGVVAARAAQETPSVVVPASSTASTGPAVQPEVVVHVVGEVGQPGLVRLPEGSRVAEAVSAAGGATPAADLAAVNLARLLVDGEQLVVPGPGGVPGTAGASVDAAADGLVDLNAADAAALDALPGIGPVLAQRIVDWRTEHGRFTVVDELAEVSGIGPSLLEGVRELVRVG